MDLLTVAAYIFGLIVVLLFVRAAVMPIRLLGSILYRACIGTSIIWIGNLIAGIVFNLTIAINPLTAVVAGAYGPPGYLLLLLLARQLT